MKETAYNKKIETISIALLFYLIKNSINSEIFYALVVGIAYLIYLKL